MTSDEHVESVSIPIALDHRLCKACGICVAICPNNVYDRDHLGYPVIARPDACIQCLRCELHCPDFAIEIVRRERKRSATAKKAAVAGPAPRRRAGAPAGAAPVATAGAREFTPDELGGPQGVDPGACGDEGTG